MGKKNKNNFKETGTENLQAMFKESKPPKTYISIRAKKVESLHLLNDYIKLNREKPNNPHIEATAKYSVHAGETIVLLLKLYPLYKDKYHEADELLKFASCYLKTGLLNGLPAIVSVDPNLEIIHEVMDYIAEVREDYFNAEKDDERIERSRYLGYEYSRNFKDFFDEKDARNMHMYNLFCNNVYGDSYEYKFFNDTTASLERMLEDYDQYRDSLLYRLEADKLTLSDLIDDPFLQFNTYVREKYRYFEKDGVEYISDDNEIKEVVITSNSAILDFAIKASYIIPDLDVECSYINEDGIIKIYCFKDGVLTANHSYNRSRIIKAIYNMYKSTQGFGNGAINEVLEMIELNVGHLKDGERTMYEVADFFSTNTGGKTEIVTFKSLKNVRHKSNKIGKTQMQCKVRSYPLVESIINDEKFIKDYEFILHHDLNRYLQNIRRGINLADSGRMHWRRKKDDEIIDVGRNILEKYGKDYSKKLFNNNVMETEDGRSVKKRKLFKKTK